VSRVGTTGAVYGDTYDPLVGFIVMAFVFTMVGWWLNEKGYIRWP
jgi:hypothetical protein